MHPESAKLLAQIFLEQEAVWPEKISEEFFFQDVVAQGMAPLLFQRLAATPCKPKAWPDTLLLRLRKTALQQAAFEVIAERDLRHLLSVFADIHVYPLLLKGTPLSYTLYPEPGLRPRCDTDLLILAKDQRKVKGVMKKMGYAPLHEAQVDYINTQMSYARKNVQGIRCCYDIHWQVSNCNRQFSQDFTCGKIFAQAKAIPALGEHAQTLNKVDAFILACFHRAGHFSHSGDRLIWLYDIHLFCQEMTGPESKQFYERTKELQILSLCSDAIETAQSWFGTVWPQAVQAVVQVGKEKNAEEASYQLLGNNRNDGIKRITLLELQGLPSWYKRFLYIVQNLFPPPDFMLWRYQKERKFFLPWLYVRRFTEGLRILFHNK
ncbi:nucleotidyltransferase family protein [Desulfobulbus sp. TB]|nr:nucleotidyltransferase family protein [Desulfobulbus sp. TB]